MKKFIISAASLAIAISSVYAVEGALDLRSRATLRQIAMEKKASFSPNACRGMRTHTGKLADNLAQSGFVGAFVKLADGATSEDLAELGIHVMTIRGNIAVCMVPVDRVEELSLTAPVKAMSIGRKVHTNMDRARQSASLDAVHAGEETSNHEESRLPYTGKGVLLGVFDEGIDPGHINFLNPDGSHRVAYLSHIVAQQAEPGYTIRGYTNEEISMFQPIANFSTDEPGSFHGTHTLGIAGGAYRGNVTMADYSKFTDKDTPVPLIDTPNPYYGAAPDATLTASCGMLVDQFIALGIDQMCQFAYEYNLPTVLSLSLGSNSGPHDVNSFMSQFFDLTMTKAPDNPNPPIICISAGNEGDRKIALKKTLTSYDDVLQTMIWPYYMQYDPDVEGSVTLRQDDIAIFSADDTKLDVKAVIYNKNRGYRPALQMPVVGDGIGSYYITDEYFQVTEEDQINAQLAKWFDGMVGVGGAIEPETGRYYAMVDYALQNSQSNLNDDYILGFEIRIRPGEEIPEGGLKVECYCKGQTTEMYNYNQPNFDDGSRNGSISDMAVSPKLIVVGAYNSREDWLCLDGLRSSYIADDPLYFKPGYVSGFSSYGTLLDGRNLPTVCAPGSSVISSVSRYFSRQIDDSAVPYTFQAKATDADGNINYWKQEPGTSMACPFLAGTIACWLEADPTLEYSDVRDIIEKTAVVDDQVRAAEDPVQWGAGKFDALAGLKEVLRRKSSINSVIADADQRLIVTPTGANTYNVFLGQATELDTRVYNTQGMLVKSLSTRGDELTLDLSDMTPGVYILTVNRYSDRILVK